MILLKKYQNYAEYGCPVHDLDFRVLANISSSAFGKFSLSLCFIFIEF